MSCKILVVSQLFEPQNEIGALRPTKFVKLLSEKGYDIDVFTSADTLVNADYRPSGFNIIYDRERNSPGNSIRADSRQCISSSEDKRKNTGKGILKLLRQEIAMTYRQILAFQNGSSFLEHFKVAIKLGRLDMGKYQCVFTTFGPVGSVLVGMYIKKYYSHIKWINDFRDPMVSQIMPKLFHPLYGYLQAKSLRMCDSAVTVSEGYYRRMVRSTNAFKFHVIPNGYDKKDAQFFEGILPDKDKFSFVYVGSLYEGKRDISPVFSALRQLCDEGYIRKEQIIFHYAGRDAAYLQQQAQVHQMEEVVFNHGMISRQECLKLQAASRFLVLSTWNDRGEEGVFPGKFIEYMLIDRPIIAVIDGNLAHSEVTATIQQYNLGVSLEKANPATKVQLYEWLKMQARCFCTGQAAAFTPDRNGIDAKYNWINIVKRFGELIE